MLRIFPKKGELNHDFDAIDQVAVSTICLLSIEAALPRIPSTQVPPTSVLMAYALEPCVMNVNPKTSRNWTKPWLFYILLLVMVLFAL